MEKTVIIAEIKSNDKFINVIDNNGVSYGIGREKSPLLAKQMENKKVGDEITGSYWSKSNDKGIVNHYLFDIDDKKSSGSTGGAKKPFTPRDKALDAAIGAANATATLLSLEKEKKPEDVEGAFDMFFNLITSKITK